MKRKEAPMNNRKSIHNGLWILAIAMMCPAIALSQSSDSTATFPPELEKHLSRETLAIGVINLKTFNLANAVRMQTAASGMAEQTANQKIEEAKKLQRQIDKLAAAHVDRLFVMLSPQDRSIERTTWVGKVNADGDVTAARNVLEDIHSALGVAGQPIAKQRVLIGGLRDHHVAALANCEAQSAAVAREALASLADCEFGVVMIGNKDSRQVLSELAPKFPPPFDKLSGKDLAKGVRWSSVGFSLQKSFGKWLVQCNNDQLPRQLEQVIPGVGDFLQDRKWVAPKIAELLSNALKTKAEDEQLQVDLSSLLQKEGGLVEVMKGITRLQNRQEHLAQLAAIVRGCHAYEEAHKTLPATANYDNDGKPLLSWRVHILPHMNQRNLYRLFRLDEPWDSAHNRKIASHLPACYFAADASETNRERGKTVYVRPTGKRTLFDGEAALKYGEIHDGTVNTVMVLRTSDDNAVVWTKPTDWKFDPEHPREGLGLKQGEDLEIATVDSTTHVLRGDITDDQLRNLIDPQDGNIVSMTELRK